METVFKMERLFGTFLADGDVGNRFRFCEVDAVLSRGEVAIFDFEGVTNMTDSFSNACFANLFADHPTADSEQRIQFRNCTSLVKMFVQRSIALGRARGQHA